MCWYQFHCLHIQPFLLLTLTLYLLLPEPPSSICHRYQQHLMMPEHFVEFYPGLCLALHTAQDHCSPLAGQGIHKCIPFFGFSHVSSLVSQACCSVTADGRTLYVHAVCNNLCNPGHTLHQLALQDMYLPCLLGKQPLNPVTRSTPFSGVSPSYRQLPAWLILVPNLSSFSL